MLQHIKLHQQLINYTVINFNLIKTIRKKVLCRQYLQYVRSTFLHLVIVELCW